MRKYSNIMTETRHDQSRDADIVKVRYYFIDENGQEQKVGACFLIDPEWLKIVPEAQKYPILSVKPLVDENL